MSLYTALSMPFCERSQFSEISTVLRSLWLCYAIPGHSSAIGPPGLFPAAEAQNHPFLCPVCHGSLASLRHQPTGPELCLRHCPLQAASSLNGITETTDTCRTGARNLKFPVWSHQDSCLLTLHYLLTYIKATEQTSFLHVCASLSHIRLQAKGGNNKLSPQKGQFFSLLVNNVSSSQVENQNRLQKINETLSFATSTSFPSVISTLQIGQLAS